MGDGYNYYREPRPFRRRPGTRVVYGTAQTARYKSLQSRQQRALEIVSQWPLRVSEQPVDAGRTLYLFASQRSSEGFWTVIREESTNPAPPPPAPDVVPNPGLGGIAGAIASVFAVSLSTTGWASGLIQGFTAVPSAFAMTGLQLPWLVGERFNGTVPQTIPSGLNPRIITIGRQDGQTLAALNLAGIGYWVRNIKLYLMPQIMPILLFRWIGNGQPEPPNFTTGPGQFEYQAPPDLNTPLSVIAAPEVIPPAVPVVPVAPAPDLGNPGGNPTRPLEPIPPGAPNRPNYTCDCPDFTRYQLAVPDSPWLSEQSDRDWTDSRAGTDDYCKHILAVALYRGDSLA
jgi:hypothetical protein